MSIIRLKITDEMEVALSNLKESKFKFLENPEILKTILSEYYSNFLEKRRKKENLINLAEEWDFWVTKEEKERIRKSYEETKNEDSSTWPMTLEEFSEYLKK